MCIVLLQWTSSVHRSLHLVKFCVTPYHLHHCWTQSSPDIADVSCQAHTTVNVRSILTVGRSTISPLPDTTLCFRNPSSRDGKHSQCVLYHTHAILLEMQPDSVTKLLVLLQWLALTIGRSVVWIKPGGQLPWVFLFAFYTVPLGNCNLQKEHNSFLTLWSMT